ncbi:MAG: tyrosine-type recombinase/integrase, partial [Rhodanobacteraceae bacterium]
MDLSTVRNRERLKPQREPYWHKIDKGRFLGYRPSRIGGGGSWIARWYDAEQWRNRFHALGDFGDLIPSERYGAASKAAREWLEHVGAGGSLKPVTVKQACERYATGKPDAAARFERYVYHDPIANTPLQKLTDRQVRAWRERLANRPALVTRRKRGSNVTRRRSAVTLNRDMVALRAALNQALELGDALTARAWRAALKPADTVGSRRNLYLDREQRKALIEALPADAAPFVRGLCALPLRPGALAGLRVGDFDPRRKELMIERDKAGGGRAILLQDSKLALFREQARSKLPAAPLFARADGKAWDKDAWKGPVKDAVRAAGLPAGATAYTLRHSTITDLVTGGLDLMTVAQVSGTSVRMIEKHYAHLQRERAR